ncbi:MAG: hypothetical protein ACIPMY_02940 [Rickettsia endosymbiont of Pentastiridius leporinus]
MDKEQETVSRGTKRIIIREDRRIYKALLPIFQIQRVHIS